MKIKVFKEKDKIKFNIPGDDKNYTPLDMALMVSLGKTPQIKEKFGQEAPELDITCELSLKEENEIKEIMKYLLAKY